MGAKSLCPQGHTRLKDVHYLTVLLIRAEFLNHSPPTADKFHMRLSAFALVLFSFIYAPVAGATDADAQIDKLISQLTLKEKIHIMGGNDPCTNAISRLRIPKLCVSDGPLGVNMGKSTAFPSGIAVGATFDPEIYNKEGSAIGEELRAKGSQVILGPTVNINRVPFGGRGSESNGEDPFLTAQLSSSYIRGVQSQGVLACVKHFVANDQEYERHTVNVQVDERTLNEIYYPPFKAAVDADVGCLMSAYNKVNGPYSAQSAELLKNQLRGKWHYKGFVISDWEGNHSAAQSANAGLDLEMPFAKFYAKPLLAAVKKGEVSEKTIDASVRNLLHAMQRTGLLGPKPDFPPAQGPESKEHQQLAEKIAEESGILLKNAGVLPLKSGMTSIAVLGPNAAKLRTGEGGSSKVDPFIAVSPLDALKERLGRDVQVNYQEGVSIPGDPLPPIASKDFRPEINSPKHGLKMEFFRNENLEGKPARVTLDPVIHKTIASFTPEEMDHDFSLRWTGYFYAPEKGDARLSVQMMEGSRLYVDGKKILEDWEQYDPTRDEETVPLSGKKWHKIILEYRHGGANSPPMTNMPQTLIDLGMAKPDPGKIDRAVAAAKKSDVAVIFAGLGNEMEAEGLDRKSLDLPADQRELIKKVSAANPNTIVVLTSGSAVNFKPWMNDVKAVVQQFYPGEEGGHAMAHLLTGDANFSGKLPVTILNQWKDSCAYGTLPGAPGGPTGGQQIIYKEGIKVGYRCPTEADADFPFGFGLSYTDFSFHDLSVQTDSASTDAPKVSVQFEVKNDGKVAGTEIAQLYVGERDAKLPRPTRELKAFQRVTLKPGEKKTVTMKLDRAAFAYYDPKVHDWVVDPSKFTLSVGNSSRASDLPLQADVQLSGKPQADGAELQQPLHTLEEVNKPIATPSCNP